MGDLRRGVTKGRWRPLNDGGPTRGDALRDIATTDGKLSVYEVADDGMLGRCLAAMAISTGHLQAMDMATFDREYLVSQGIEVSETLGTLADKEVNSLHRELANLTVPRVAVLALSVSYPDIRRWNVFEVATAIRTSLVNSWIELEAIPDGVLARAKEVFAKRNLEF